MSIDEEPYRKFKVAAEVGIDSSSRYEKLRGREH